MATALSKNQVMASLSDNTIGDITPADLRNAFETVFQRTAVSVREYGAVGDGVADDTAALRAAIAACLDREKRAISKLVLPPGTYRITDTLTITAAGLIIEGAGPRDIGGGSSLEWHGPTGKPMIALHGHKCAFRDFTIRPMRRLDIGIRLAKYANAGISFPPTHCEFQRLLFGSPNNALDGQAPFGYCVEFQGGVNGSIDQNNDYHYFLGCQFEKYGEAAVHMVACSQVHQVIFFACGMNAEGTNGKYAIKQSSGGVSNGGFFKVYGGGGGYHTVADFRLSQPNSHILIEGWNSENSAALLTHEYTNPAGISWPVTLRNGRFETNRLRSDGRFIWLPYTGPFVFDGWQVTIYSDVHPRIYLNCNGQNTGCITHTNNYYEHQNLSLGAVLQLGEGTWRCWDENNRTQQNSTGLVKHMPSLTNVFSSAWNDKPLRLGDYRLWIDGSGRLRMKRGAPTSDTDGTVVGSQS
jgi:hypothetical protein